jgi:hypothetical protein
MVAQAIICASQYAQTDGGAGFYRFPAWARMKPNDVSPGHVIFLAAPTDCQSFSIPHFDNAA